MPHALKALLRRRNLGLMLVVALVFGTSAVAVGGTPQQRDSNAVYKYSGNVSDAVDPENADNDVVKFDTNDPNVADSMGRKVSETVSQVTDQVELNFFFVGRDCAAGSPRIDLFVDTNGDHKFDTLLNGYVGPSGSGCVQNKWQYLDLANLNDPTPRWGVNNGFPLQSWSSIVATFGNDDVVFGHLVDDSQAFAPNNRGIAYYDLVSIGNRTFTSHEDGN